MLPVTQQQSAVARTHRFPSNENEMQLELGDGCLRSFESVRTTL